MTESVRRNIPRSLLCRYGSLRLDQPPAGGFDDGLGAGRGAELGARIVDVEIDGALGQADNLRDFSRSFAARNPGQDLDFAIVEFSEASATARCVRRRPTAP